MCTVNEGFNIQRRRNTLKEKHGDRIFLTRKKFHVSDGRDCNIDKYRSSLWTSKRKTL